MEMNRFDALTHYRNWASEHPPSVHQRKLLRKYLCFVLSQWPEEDAQDPNSPHASTSRTPYRPVLDQVSGPGMQLKTPTIRQILEAHGHSAVQGQLVTPDHPPKTNNQLTVNSPYSLHPGSIYAAPPLPAHMNTVQQPGPQGTHQNLPAKVPMTGTHQTVPVSHLTSNPSVVIPRLGKPIVITPQKPTKRANSLVPPQGPPQKPLNNTTTPCTLTTINEQPLKMHIKKRASDKINNQWKIEELPAKTHHTTRSSRILPPPPDSPEDEDNLMMDIPSDPNDVYIAML